MKCDWCRKDGELVARTLTLSPYHAKRTGAPTQTVWVCADTEACERRSARAEASRERMLEEGWNQ